MNQSFFKGFFTVSGKPWLSEDGTFLFYDFVHLIENWRNLWLTERVVELKSILDTQSHVAPWQDSHDLYNEESKSGDLLKMS